MFNTANLNTTVYQATNPVTYTYVEQGLWDAGNTFIASARAVTDLPDTYRYNFSSMPQWNYLPNNVDPIVPGLEVAMDLQVGCHVQLYTVHVQAMTALSVWCCACMMVCYMQLSIATWMTSCIGNWHANGFVWILTDKPMPIL